MNSPRDLRRRIKSISGTSQITRAMQMVAASKMRKAQLAAIEAQAFARMLYRMQRSAVAHAPGFEHPLIEVRPVRRRAVILIAADKGLRRAQHQRLPPRVTVRSGDDGIHHRRAQSGPVRHAYEAAARRRIRLWRRADLPGGAGHCRPRP